jgi:hypothetical protein
MSPETTALVAAIVEGASEYGAPIYLTIIDKVENSTIKISGKPYTPPPPPPTTP